VSERGRSVIAGRWREREVEVGTQLTEAANRRSYSSCKGVIDRAHLTTTERAIDPTCARCDA
jgi:hypothetical protein